MKKVIKLLGLLFIICLTGCAMDKNVNSLTDAYNNSKITSSMKGYTLDLRVYGLDGNNNINEIIRTDNYNNSDYQIMKVSGITTTNYAIKEGKTYLLKNNKYEKTSALKNYTNPNSYLDGIKGITKASKTKDQKIATNTYKVYNVTFSKEAVNKMLKDTDLKTKATTDISGEVWLNSDNRVYKIYYKLNKLTVYASYFGYNNTHVLNLTK